MRGRGAKLSANRGGRLVEERQLGFPFPSNEIYEADNFLQADSNAEALAWVERMEEWPGRRLAVFGPPGSGKTHLLHRFAERRGAALLKGEVIGNIIAEPPAQPLAIDDADAAPSEAALLHLLNAAADAGQPVLLAARAAPSRWSFSLPDLVSRLRAITAVSLHDPDDALLRALLARLLADRQLVVAEPVQDFLLTQLPRTGAMMREVSRRLDEASLAAGGKITRLVAMTVVRTLAPNPEMGSGDGSPAGSRGSAPGLPVL